MGKKKTMVKKIFSVKISSVFRRWVVERMEKSALENGVSLNIIYEKREKPFLFVYSSLECSVEGEKESVRRFFDRLSYFVRYARDA